MSEKLSNILAIDCGNHTTKACLIDQLEETYRLIAHTQTESTHQAPWHDISIGLITVIKKIEKLAQRQLLTTNDEPLFKTPASTDGLGGLVIVTSAAPPLQISLAGLTGDVSLAAAQRAATATYSYINTEFALSQNRAKRNPEYRLQKLTETPSDLILLTGGTDGGATHPVLNMAQFIALALKYLPHPLRPDLIYAGNVDLRAMLAEIFTELTHFKPVDNLLPTLTQENLVGVQTELDSIYIQRKGQQLAGFEKLVTWGTIAPGSTLKSFAQTIHYIGQSYEVDVLGIDVGDQRTSLITKRKHAEPTTTPLNMGIGHGLRAYLQQDDLKAIQKWLPFSIESEALRNYLHNKFLRFDETAQFSYQDMLKDVAVVRQILRQAKRQAKKIWGYKPIIGFWELIIGTGQILTALPHLELAVLAILDGLEPAGIPRLALDKKGLMGMLGAVASQEPLAAAQVTGYDALDIVGTIVAPVGADQPGKRALRLKITYGEEYEEEDRVAEFKIPAGVIQLIPLGANEKATLEIYPSRNFSMHPTGESPGSGVATIVEGGSIGLIVDTRGRPLQLPQDDEKCRQKIQEWLIQLNLSPGIIEGISSESESSDHAS